MTRNSRLVLALAASRLQFRRAFTEVRGLFGVLRLESAGRRYESESLDVRQVSGRASRFSCKSWLFPRHTLNNFRVETCFRDNDKLTLTAIFR